MSQQYAFLFEFVGFSLPALLWGAWELWSLKRERAKDAAAADSVAKVSNEPARHPEGK